MIPRWPIMRGHTLCMVPHLEISDPMEKNGIHLETNLDAREIACKGGACCGGSWVYVPEVARRFQESRDAIGGPIIVVSGYRCERHNARSGGYPESRHRFGEALDLYCPGLEVSVERWAEDLKKIWPRVALYERRDGAEGFQATVHVDLGLLGQWVDEVKVWKRYQRQGGTP